MTKRKAEPFLYDSEKKYDISDFENTTIKNLYMIGKCLGVRDVKKPKKSELASLILTKHEQAKETTVKSVLDGIIDNVVITCEHVITTKSESNAILKNEREFQQNNFLQSKQRYFLSWKRGCNVS